MSVSGVGTLHVLEQNEWFEQAWYKATRSLWTSGTGSVSRPNIETAAVSRNLLNRDLQQNAGGYHPVGNSNKVSTKVSATTTVTATGGEGYQVWGEHFQIENLYVLFIRNAGHLLSLDAPKTALDMIYRFLNDEVS